MKNKILMSSNYKTQAEDTTKEAELLQFSLWRRLNFQQKAELFRRTYRRISNLIFINLKQQFDSHSEKLIRKKYIEKKLGKIWLKILSHNYSGDLMLEDPLWLAYKLDRIFNTLKIKYYVGGSVSSSIHGEIRYTEDLDIVIYLESAKVELLIKTLQNEFYISEIAVNEALRGEINSFNIIHLQTIEKADLFIGQNDDFSLSRMERRQRININDNAEEGFYICTPEDIILQKLIWYKITAKESQKQWRDILGVLKLQGDKLDFHYLWYWGDQLGLLTEFDRAFSESRVS